MRTRLLLAAAFALAANPLHATNGGVRAVDRVQQGDTLVLVLHLVGQPAAHVSEPFHLADRVRLYLDLNETTAAPDSAALAALQGQNLLALTRRPRTGGLAFIVDVQQLADYRVVQGDSTLQLRLLAAHPAPAPVAAAAPVTPVLRAPAPPFYAKLPSPLLLLGTLPAALLLLAFRRRRRPAPAAARVAAPHAQPPATTSPDDARVRADGRLWAVRTLAASGASTADLVRRTGVPREAIRFLEVGSPAVSAASGSNYRPAAPAAAPLPGARER